MYRETHYLDGTITISERTSITYECLEWKKKKKKWKPSSNPVEGLVITSRAEIEICCLACPFAFVLGNESPLRGGHAGPLPIPLRFNYPACFLQGNEVGVTTGAKWQPVPAALPLSLSFPQRSAANWKGREGRRVKKMRNNREKKNQREDLPQTSDRLTKSRIFTTDLQLPYVFIRVREKSGSGKRGELRFKVQ